MNTRTALLLTAAALLLVPTACGTKRSVVQGRWTLVSGDGITIRQDDKTVATGLTAEYTLDDGRTVSSRQYADRRFRSAAIDDAFGRGRSWEITYTDRQLPTLVQTFCIYDHFVLTDIAVQSADGVRVRQMAPVVTAQPMTGHGMRRLFVPFDNDAWIRFATQPADTATAMRSYEVTAIFDPRSREGLVVGAIDHGRWKNAIDVAERSQTLRALSGVADELTRDRHAHGVVSGTEVRSSRVLIGRFIDWRTGLETYADANASAAPPRQWQRPMPVGWNSWGALAFKVNHDNSTRISDFLASRLQGRSFCTADGQLYTGLDSGWNNFSDDELSDFARRCHDNNQVACIYWTPFTDWGKNPEARVPVDSAAHPELAHVRYKDVYLYADGRPQELDGAYAIDPTHPAVRAMMERTHDMFARLGYGYVKMDFMTHGRMEADGWHMPGISTGTEAYNYGMHLIDSIFSDMYINLSISPIFPAQYAQSRRIACDAWNKMKDTEYTLNALSWGWWADRVYSYNDADHVVLRDATEGENRARITSSVITGLYITGDDFSSDSTAIARALSLLTNSDINRLATGRSFRPLRGGDSRSEHIFTRREEGGDMVVAAFNYTEQPLTLRLDTVLAAELVSTGSAPDRDGHELTELWSHAKTRADQPVTIPAKDVKVFRLKKI